MRGFVLGLALLFLAAPAAAQSTADNLSKVVALRTRLTTEFSVVGTGSGESQPAPERKDSEGWMKWGDSTIYLGFYIGTLATQHYLFTHSNDFPGADSGDPDAASKTKTELYDALFALERLDSVADASFPPPCTQTPAINGFFIRDDVPQDFYQHFPPITTIFSDFVDPALTNKEMSQDQVYHLLSGLALVKKLIPKGTTESGKDLHDWAVEQARRIIEHVSKDNWVIKNPACNRDVNRGPLASGFSGGTRQAISFITDGAFEPDTAESLQQIWDGFKNPNSPIYIDVDNLHMALAIAAVGNGWGDTTADDIAALAEKQDWPLYPLLHRVLQGDTASGWCRTGDAVNKRAREMLDELPKGAEPASPNPGGPAVHGFTSTNRFIRGKDHAYVGEAGSDGRRYSGLDYLLLFGLYAIATPATWEGGNGAGVPDCPAPPKDAGTDGAGGGSSGSGGTKNKADESDDSGCGCRLPSNPTKSVPATLLAAVVLGAGLRRRHSSGVRLKASGAGSRFTATGAGARRT